MAKFDVTLERLQHGKPDVAPIITGPRGCGKTVLLNELLARAKDRRWYAAKEEATPNVAFSSLVALLAHEVLLEMSSSHRRSLAVRRALGVLKAFTSISVVGISIDIDAEKISGTADSGIFDRDLRRLFVEIGQVAQDQGVGVVFAIDELQVVPSDDLQALYSALHQTCQAQLPVAFVGAGLFPSYKVRKVRRVSTIEARMSSQSFVRLGPLDVRSAVGLLQNTAAISGGRFTTEALAVALAYCAGNVWLLQMAGSHAWNESPSSLIGEPAMRRATARVEKLLQDWYFPQLLAGMSRVELRVLSEIAAAMGSEGTRASYLNLANEVPEDTLESVLDVCTDLDLILAERTYDLDGDAYISFSVPRLKEYLCPSGVH